MTPAAPDPLPWLIPADTSHEAEELQRHLFMTMTPERRLQAVAAMVDEGLRLVAASLDAAGTLDPVERRRRVFRRVYGGDLPADTIERICVILQ